MMPLRLFPSLKNIVPYLKQPSSQVHTSVSLLNSKDSSSSSSSSDSSDSDSDKENQKSKKLTQKTSTEDRTNDDETTKISNTNERLNALLDKINKASKQTSTVVSTKETEINLEGMPSFISWKGKSINARPKSQIKNNTIKQGIVPTAKGKTVNVAIKPKNIRFSEASKEEKLKRKSHEQQLKQAAKDVAETLGGDTQKTELELLVKALNLKQETSDKVVLPEKEAENPSDLRQLLSGMKVDTSSPDTKVGIPEKIEKMMGKFKAPSIAESVLYAKSITKPRRHAMPAVAELKVAHSNFGILKNFPTEQKDELQLPTWDTMAVREMRLSVLTIPQNVFQELIQWTNEGKIWHFPIDNEQGMKGEENIPFSDHVFMERHLKDWCPKKGPIRHFMELVCTGLSKNPYMTVDEKIEHITWYRNYFEDKKELLHELGVLDDKPTPLAATDKKKIEA